MRRKRLYICLLIVLAVPLLIKFGCTPQVLGKTGFDVTLSVTGMTRFTSVFRVLYAFAKD